MGGRALKMGFLPSAEGAAQAGAGRGVQSQLGAGSLLLAVSQRFKVALSVDNSRCAAFQKRTLM